MTGGMLYIFSAGISPDMLKFGRVTKVKVLFLVQVFVFNFDLFTFSVAILERVTHDLRIRSTVTLPTELQGRTEKVRDDLRW